MTMLDYIKHWLAKRRGVAIGHHDAEHLPTPKAIGDQLLAKARLIVLDLETTGLNPNKDEVIAIGAVAIENGVIHLDDQFDLVLRRPELDISETVLIHGIGPEALTQGHETEDALLYLLEWMNGDPVLAFHSAFDQKFLEKTLRQQLGYTAAHIWIDVAELLPVFCADAKPRGGTLDHWADCYGLSVSERHHAAADALVTAELALVAFNKAGKLGVHTLKELTEKLHYQRRLKNMQRI